MLVPNVPGPALVLSRSGVPNVPGVPDVPSVPNVPGVPGVPRAKDGLGDGRGCTSGQ